MCVRVSVRVWCAYMCVHGGGCERESVCVCVCVRACVHACVVCVCMHGV